VPESDVLVCSTDRIGVPMPMKIVLRGIGPAAAYLADDRAAAEFDLHIRLNIGQGKAVVYACDLSERYVDFNKGDISSPSALGG
jgi:N-acetylglutamate synthase/N-acetylornithine aminotransferase